MRTNFPDYSKSGKTCRGFWNRNYWLIQQLADQGNTILIIEHNLDLIKVADYIIDLGPEGGNGGGEVVATGTPHELAKNKKSVTGQYLRGVL